jgi:hypothetical protein
MRVLFGRFGVGELPPNEKRSHLATSALIHGIVKPNEF